MKYKITAIVVALTVLGLAVAASVPKYDKEKRIHQHKEKTVITECDCDKSELCTHLPLVLIDTDGVEIPGNVIRDENGRTAGYTTAEDGASTIYAKIKVIDNDEKRNHPSDKADVASKISIRIRGNSSRTFDKKGYLVKLLNDDLTNNPQPLMGMDSHHEWALHGPYLDKTLIRNYMCYNIAGEIMDYAPNVRFCEVILNGEYKGVYVLCETITAGEDGARLNLSVNKKENRFNGYCIRLDRDKGDTQNITPFTKYTLRTKMQHQIVFPGRTNLTTELKNRIEDDFSAFEKALYSYDYDNDEYGYKKYIDVESFADYYIFNEFTCNYDAGWLSTYMYKEIDGKFRMCVWDFNSAFDAYQETFMPADHFEMQNCLWYFMLFKDEDFTEKVIERYKELRKTFLSDEYLENYIDETVEFLGDAIDRNYEVWGYSFGEKYDLMKPTDRNPRNYDDAIADMKEFIRVRSKYMDENIETLRQYSAESKIKKFNENAN